MKSNEESINFGMWPSPISATGLGKGLGFSDLAWDEDGSLVWRESRSDQAALVVLPPNEIAPHDLNSEMSSRGKVGYGGGEFTVGKGHAYFVDGESGRIFRQPLHQGQPKAITPKFGGAASPTLSPDGSTLLYVHTYEGEDSLAIAYSDGQGWPARLASGYDFYMQPCWHPGGEQVAWITWNHPNMPWDSTELYLGDLTSNGAGLPTLNHSRVIVGAASQSVFQPQFSSDGKYLAYIADKEGWWQVYLYDLERETHRLLTPEKSEFGAPAWVQGVRTYAFTPDSKSIVVSRIDDSVRTFWIIDIESGDSHPLDIGSGYTWFEQPAISPDGRKLAVVASSGTMADRVIVHEFGEETTVVRRSTPENIPAADLSQPQSIHWTDKDGETIYGIYYPPAGKEYPQDAQPPLMVLVHGGPTSQRGLYYTGGAQYWATRGYAVLDVNYRGSTGYGREYRDALKGNWGVYDVEDSISGATYLVDQGLANPDKIVIMGGSAGGLTVLQALVTSPGFFKAGVCLYGVANQFSLMMDTHKFEAHYSDSLIGALPEAAGKYRERSPIFAADRIQDPMIVFQGEDDQVVPRSQSDDIVAALEQNNVPHAYHLYAGEGHGFRKTETIEHMYKHIERFLKQHVIYC